MFLIMAYGAFFINKEFEFEFNPAPVYIFACTVVVTTRMGECDISLPRDLHFNGRRSQSHDRSDGTSIFGV